MGNTESNAEANRTGNPNEAQDTKNPFTLFTVGVGTLDAVLSIGSRLVENSSTSNHSLVWWGILVATILFSAATLVYVCPRILARIRRRIVQPHEPGPTLPPEPMGHWYLTAVIIVLNIVLAVFAWPNLMKTIFPPLNYVRGAYVGVAAGTGIQGEPIDGLYDDCSISLPTDLTVEGETLYFIDAGTIRMLKNGEVITLNDLPDNQLPGLFDRNAIKLQVWAGDLFVLAGPWLDTDAGVYKASLLRLRNCALDDWEQILDFEVDPVSLEESTRAWVPDFTVNEDGIYLIRIEESGVAKPQLFLIPYDAANDRYETDDDSLEIIILDEYHAIDMDCSRIVTGGSGDLFLSVPKEGVILRISAEELAKKHPSPELFAGKSGDLLHNDRGRTPTFYYPTALACGEDCLYVMDFGLVRQITVKDGSAAACKTLGGRPYEEVIQEDGIQYDIHDLIPAKDYRFSPNADAALCVGADGELFVSEPDLGFLYYITTSPSRSR